MPPATIFLIHYGSSQTESLGDGSSLIPNSRCFADVTTKMHHAVLMIPLDSPRSPFSISPNDDVIIIISMTTGSQLVEMTEKIS